MDLAAQSVFQDGREVATKRRKTFTTIFFPVGVEPLAIFEDYLRFLKEELGFGPDDPLFASTRIGHDPERAFEVQGLSREHWKSAEPIRGIFRAAFTGADMPYVNPHSLRTTLARLGEKLCRTPEEWKAWSQNLGHEHEATTFASYGHVPEHRQADLMRGFAAPKAPVLGEGLDIAALEAFLASAKAARAA